jgi:hypothetical protein
MEAKHYSAMKSAASLAWRAGMDLSEVDDFSGKGTCIWLNDTHDVQLCFFIQGTDETNMRCGFMIPSSESGLMQLLDHQITDLTIPIYLDHQMLNHKMNRTTVQRGERVNSRIYLNYQDLDLSFDMDTDGLARVMSEIMLSLEPAIHTYVTMRDLHMFNKAYMELLP